MSNQEILVEELVRLQIQSHVLQRMLTTVISELALTQHDPAAYLEELISSEQDAVYGAATTHVDISPSVERVMKESAVVREAIFKASRETTQRMIATRRGA